MLAALAVTTMALLAVGMLQLARDSDSLIAARSPTWAGGSGDARLDLSARGLSLPGFGQFPVVWLAPVTGHQNDPWVVPPGLSRLPAPGEGVLSPGLVARGWTAQDFGLRPSTAGLGPHGVIGSEGVATQSEGWVYARPAGGRSLGHGGALLPSRGYTSEPKNGISLETMPQVPPFGDSAIGVGWMIVAPSLFLLASAARAMSGVRDARAQTLWRLGIDSARIRVLLVVETSLLAVSGALPALLFWTAGLSRLTAVPLTGTTLKADALRSPLWISASCVVATVLLAAGTAAVGQIGARSLKQDARKVRTWHAIPLVVAFLMMASGPWLDPVSGLRPILLFGGLLLTFAALPMALPTAMAHIGAWLGQSGKPATWLAGRRLSLRSANLSRPAAMVGALVFVAGAAFALYDHLVPPEESSGSTGNAAAFDVSWRDPQPGDLSVVEARDRSLAILPVQLPRSGGERIIFTSCAELQRWIDSGAGGPCARSQPGNRRSTSPHLSAGPLRATGHRVTVGADSSMSSGTAFVIGPMRTTSRQVMQTFRGLPAVNITPVGGEPPTQDPRVGWMLAGWTLATLLLLTALLREIGDRGLSSMGDISHLLRLGLTREEIDQSYRWRLLPPVAVAIVIGFLGAVFFALRGYQLGITSNNLERIAVVAGLAATVSVATFAVVFAVQHRICDLSDENREI